MKRLAPFFIPFGAGLVLGIAFATAWFLRGAYLSPVAAPPSNAGQPLSSDTSGSVEVSAQAAGDTVLVDSITVPPPGVWVAVREVAADGTLGNILGAARARGPLEGLVVPLLRATEPATRYAVELYRDNGDDAFDPNTDSVYVDFDTGTRVVSYFMTLAH